MDRKITPNKIYQPSKQKIGIQNLQVNNSESKDYTENKVTVVIGDSKKRVQGWKIGKKVGHKGAVKAFPGATTDDMKCYV